ncbi:MAG TPA: hypothetical protein VF297_24820 [Pyrinomonadaceae bacterium]
MPVSRRRFLSGATAVLTTAAALQLSPIAFAQIGAKPDPARDFPLPQEAHQSPLISFTRETFEPYVGGIFRARAGANSIEMKLEKVRGLQLSARGKGLTKKSRQSDSFALDFSSSGTLTDLTTIYDIEHGALGTFALFLTRHDNPQGGYYYEAVFNHVR